MERPQTPEIERKMIEARGAGISGVRQAATVYLVSHGISQDRAWQVAMGAQLEMRDEDGELWQMTTMERIFAALDDARYMIEAQNLQEPQLPLEQMTADATELVTERSPRNDDDLQPYKCPSCGQEISILDNGDESLFDHALSCPVLERQRGGADAS